MMKRPWEFTNPRHLAKRFPLARNLSLVLSGTLLSQVIAILTLPVLARVIDPGSFGEYQILSSSVAVLMPFAALRLEYAILNHRREHSLLSVLFLCVIVNLAMTAVLAVVVLLILPMAVPIAKSKIWGTWLLPVAFLASGLFQTAGYLPIRAKRYGLLAVGKVGQTATFGLGSVATAIYAIPSATALAAWDIISRLAAAAIILSQWLRGRSHRSLQRIMRPIKAIARANRHYSVFAVPSSLLGIFVSAIPVFYLSFAHSEETAGQFGMAWRAGFLPLTMVTFALSQVVSAELSEKQRLGLRGGRRILTRVTALSALLGITPILLVAFLGSEIMVLVLGTRWLEAGRMLEAMTPLLANALVTGPIGTALVIAKRSDTVFAWDFTRTAVVLGTLASAWWFGVSSIAVVALYSTAMLLMGVLYAALAYYFIDKVRTRSRRAG